MVISLVMLFILAFERSDCYEESKSLVAAVVALCICIAMVPYNSVSVDADVIYGDVNGDGKVSMLDLTSMNRYLSGMIDFTDYTALDVNCNYFIDYIDRDLILAYLVAKIDSLPYEIPAEEE